MDQRENETEAARIDREWERERERYMIASRYGRRYVPSAAAAVVMGVFSSGFGLLWLFLAFSAVGPAGGAFGLFFPLFGFLFIAVGIGTSIYQFRKARRYQAAHADYQRRRAAALDRMRE